MHLTYHRKNKLEGSNLPNSSRVRSFQSLSDNIELVCLSEPAFNPFFVNLLAINKIKSR